MNVIITGASNGIGKELKNMFLAQGHRVISLARSFENSNQCDIKCDITNKNDLDKAFEIIKNNYDNIDLLINNAGYGIHGAIELTSLEKVREQFDVNFFAQIDLIQRTLPLMQQGSKIINISSVCAFFPLPYRGLYCASKSALNSLSFSLRMELAQSKIQVTTICPGDIQTNFVNTRVKVFETNSRYQNRIKESSEKVDGRNNKRMTVEYATAKIFKIINKNKLKPMYIVSKKYKFLYHFSKLFSKNVFLNVTNKFFN